MLTNQLLFGSHLYICLQLLLLVLDRYDKNKDWIQMKIKLSSRRFYDTESYSGVGFLRWMIGWNMRNNRPLKLGWKRIWIDDVQLQSKKNTREQREETCWLAEDKVQQTCWLDEDKVQQTWWLDVMERTRR